MKKNQIDENTHILQDNSEKPTKITTLYGGRLL